MIENKYCNTLFGDKIGAILKQFETGLLDNPDLYGDIIQPGLEEYLARPRGKQALDFARNVYEGTGKQRQAQGELTVQNVQAGGVKDEAGGKAKITEPKTYPGRKGEIAKSSYRSLTGSKGRGGSPKRLGVPTPEELKRAAKIGFQESIQPEVQKQGQLQRPQTQNKQTSLLFLDQGQGIPPPPQLSQGEARSILEQGEQNHAKLNPKYSGEVFSLGKIVTQVSTNVKQKVHIFDYLRTPEKVLKKIGFEKEGIALRKGHEGYLKELPKNLDVITAWSKRVPKESNRRIFKYLDGQVIDLKPIEKEVALEIKAWLAGWAERLKLPEDSRISYYITRLFDEELLAKEFDEDLAKIISGKVPGSVYDPFLERRLGAKGYKEDVWAALDAYIKRGTRKVHMDPALKAIRDKAGTELETSALEESQFKYIQKYVHSINMRPTEIDTLIDNAIKSVFGYKFGQRPVVRLASFLRRMTYRGMLGLNPVSALRNLSQGVNTYAVLGEKYTMIGYVKLFKTGAMKELGEEGVLGSSFITDRTLNATKKVMEKIDKGLFLFFDTAERINRGAAYFGAKSKALEMGKTEAEAIEYAKGVVRKTQFTFGSIDTPLALRTDIIKTVAQFQTYTLKQIEFLGGMAKDKNFIGLLRYALGGLAFIYTIGKIFGMKPEELIPTFRFDWPPSLKVPAESIKAALNTPDRYGKPRSLKQKVKDIGKSSVGLFPGGSQIKRTGETVQALLNKGAVKSESGKTIFHIDTKNPVEVARTLSFGKYQSEEGQKYLEKLRGDRAEADKLDKVKVIYDKFQQMKREGKVDQAVEEFEAMSEEYQRLYAKVKKFEAAETLKDDLYPTYLQIQKMKKEGQIDEAIVIYDNLTEEEQKAYASLKKRFSESKDERDIFGLASDYVKAFTIDPENAWKALTTKEELGIVKGNLVEMKRFYNLKFNEEGGSDQYKKKRMKEMGIPWDEKENWKLEHVLPVKAGGDTSDTNLIPVNNELHDFYTPIDILMAKAIQSGQITRKQAGKLAIDFKVNKTITAEDVVKGLK